MAAPKKVKAARRGVRRPAKAAAKKPAPKKPRRPKPTPGPARAARPAKVPGAASKPEEVLALRLPASHEAGRADKVVAALLEGVSRSRVQRALDLGLVKVNGAPADRRTVLNPGDHVQVALPSPEEPTARAVKVPLEVLFEDAHLIAVNKPAGLLTHPVQGSDEVSVVHGLLHHTKGKLAPAGGAPRPGVVHRLDRETSGVIVLAKTDQAYHALVAQFAERTARKEYLALVDKAPRLLSGVIDAKIDRHRTVRVRMAVREDGRDAVTEWRTEEVYGPQAALVRAFPHTGRTHQIRVHLAHLGHAILGDRTYGKFDVPGFAGWPMPRVMLHAHRLTLTHPKTGQPLTITVEPPADFQALKQWLAAKYGRKTYLQPTQ
jgi:23S rRNA pseudouridine1911/1915/1917 synthase